ncbi:hypothetical protein C8R46DRAFT_32995 [Mycena filopes]|nr:hypothetical protein C8R46DRAFT_32995 [Mycena filopes]
MGKVDALVQTLIADPVVVMGSRFPLIASGVSISTGHSSSRRSSASTVHPPIHAPHSPGPPEAQRSTAINTPAAGQPRLRHCHEPQNSGGESPEDTLIQTLGHGDGGGDNPDRAQTTPEPEHPATGRQSDEIVQPIGNGSGGDDPDGGDDPNSEADKWGEWASPIHCNTTDITLQTNNSNESNSTLDPVHVEIRSLTQFKTYPDEMAPADSKSPTGLGEEYGLKHRFTQVCP